MSALSRRQFCISLMTTAIPLSGNSTVSSCCTYSDPVNCGVNFKNEIQPRTFMVVVRFLENRKSDDVIRSIIRCGTTPIYLKGKCAEKAAFGRAVRHDDSIYSLDSAHQITHVKDLHKCNTSLFDGLVATSAEIAVAHLLLNLQTRLYNDNRYQRY